MLSPQQRIIMPITNSGYGIGEQGKFCTEETPAATDLALRASTRSRPKRSCWSAENSISLRLATVFGMAPRMRIDLLVNDFVYRAVTDRFVVLFEAHFKRNYIHIRDVAHAFMHAMDKFEEMRGGPYNVGLSDANLSKAELCERIKAHVPDFVYRRSADRRGPRQARLHRLQREDRGHRLPPVHCLDDGIVESIKGYRMLRNSVYANV